VAQALQAKEITVAQLQEAPGKHPVVVELPKRESLELLLRPETVELALLPL
jgi:hypothetical protein